MRKNINPDEEFNTGPAENEEVNNMNENPGNEETQERKPKREKVKPGKRQQAYAGNEEEEANGEGDEWNEEDEELEGEEGEEYEEEEEEGEEEDMESILEEQIDAISERVKNYIMKTPESKKMKDLVKYGSMAALAIYGLRRGGLIRGLVISAAVSMAAKHLMGENGKAATA